MPAWTKDFLGKGWKFPVSVNRTTGRVEMSAYDEDIREAIEIILRTRKGERVMLPAFGSNLHQYVFGVMDYTMITSVKDEVTEALTLWEPRITNVEVEVETPDNGDGGFIVHIAYVVRNTNNPYSLVFPFYLTEGNES